MSEQKTPPTMAELRAQMDAGLSSFLAALDRLDASQLVGPVDAVGWTVRDHLVHLAVWADGIATLLRREDRWASMGLANPGSGERDYDAMNETIRRQHVRRTPAEAREWLVAAHQRIATALEGMSDADLAAPYERYAPPFTGDSGDPIWRYVAGDTFEHYAEHLPWMQAIVERRR